MTRNLRGAKFAAMESSWRARDYIDLHVTNDDVLMSLVGLSCLSSAEKFLSPSSGDRHLSRSADKDEQSDNSLSLDDEEICRAEFSLIRSVCPERKVPHYCSGADLTSMPK